MVALDVRREILERAGGAERTERVRLEERSGVGCVAAADRRRELVRRERARGLHGYPRVLLVEAGNRFVDEPELAGCEPVPERDGHRRVRPCGGGGSRSALSARS